MKKGRCHEQRFSPAYDGIWSSDDVRVRRAPFSSILRQLPIMPRYRVAIGLLIVILLHDCIADQGTYQLAKEIRRNIKGFCHVRGSPEYELARPVHNGICRAIFPKLIVKPIGTDDVSAIVRIAHKYDMDFSVRSGGHSYQCQGIKVC